MHTMNNIKSSVTRFQIQYRDPMTGCIYVVRGSTNDPLFRQRVDKAKEPFTHHYAALYQSIGAEILSFEFLEEMAIAMELHGAARAGLSGSVWPAQSTQ